MNKSTKKEHYFDFTKVIKDHAYSAVLIIALEQGIFEALKDNFLSMDEIKKNAV